MRKRILGSLPPSNRFGCGSGRPKNIRIRINNTGNNFISVIFYNSLQAERGSEQCSRVCSGHLPLLQADGAGAVLLLRYTSTVLEFLNNHWGARNRIGIGLSYRPASLHSLAKLVPLNRFLGSLKV
jgi:hypothetical protein